MTPRSRPELKSRIKAQPTAPPRRPKNYVSNGDTSPLSDTCFVEILLVLLTPARSSPRPSAASEPRVPRALPQLLPPCVTARTLSQGSTQQQTTGLTSFASCLSRITILCCLLSSVLKTFGSYTWSGFCLLVVFLVVSGGRLIQACDSIFRIGDTICMCFFL